MRTWLTRLARWLFASPPSPAPRRTTPAPRAEELEPRLALSAFAGAAAPAGCSCPCCAGGGSFTFAQGGATAYSAAVSKWAQPGGPGAPLTLTYSYSNLLDGGLGGGLSATEIRAAIQEALSRWAAVAPLNFVEVADAGPAPSGNDYAAAGRPMLRFGRLAIDGAWGTLAYGYYPGGTGLAGDIHFDTSETWRTNPRQGVDLIEVAVHEIGHALGLGHEPMPSSGGQSAIMNPYYGGRYSGPGSSYLLADDINGIRAMYGAGAGSVTAQTTAADANILRSYFQRILGRTASEGDLGFWLEARGRGMGWGQIAAYFVTSPEANGRLVDQYYSTYLGRSADAAGRASWVNALSAGMTREQFAVSLMSTPEFSSRYASADSYVQAVYAAVLGRSGTAAERSGFVSLLNSGASRGLVASYVVHSSEAYGRAVASAYSAYLDRSTDAAGRQYWVGALTGGQATLPGLDVLLLASAEYLSRND